MGFQEREFKVAGIENLMPQRELEEEGVKYTLHLEEKVKGTDRCFAYNISNNPSDLHLFQITTEVINNNELTRLYLSELNIHDDFTAKNLFKHAKEIFTKTKDKASDKDLTMKEFSKTFAVGSRNYIITYQPPTAGAINMREQYEKRVMKRIYGY